MTHPSPPTPDPNRDTSHDCRRAERCSDRSRDEHGTITPAMTERPNTLCLSCEAWARTAINGLHIDWRELFLSLPASGATSDGPMVGGSRETPIPLRASVDACMVAIETELVRWASVLTAGATRFGRREDAVRTAAAVVIAQLPELLRLPVHHVEVLEPVGPGGADVAQLLEMDGVDAVLFLARLHSRSQHLIGSSVVTRWLDHACPACRTKTLKVKQARTSGDPDVTVCQKCHQAWQDRDLDRWDAMQSALPRAERARV